MTYKVTLNEHLVTLDQNSTISEIEMDSLHRRVSKKFKECGYEAASRDCDLVNEYIDMIFKTQNYRCTHWIKVKDGELNGVWNRPGKAYKNWKTTEVKYEIDHVHPRNAGGIDDLKNFQFLSANANQFVKCSLTYDDLLRRVDLSSRLKRRIRTVLRRRARLFASNKWKKFEAKLVNHEAENSTEALQALAESILNKKSDKK